MALASIAACSTAATPGAAVVTSVATVVATGRPPAGGLAVSSPAFAAGGALPARYTCDGEAVSPPLQWSGAPDGTGGYAVVMDHQPAPGEYKWYLLVWNLDAATTHLDAGADRTGGPAVFGGNSVNRKGGYAPPCSNGPGAKPYTFTVFALSRTPTIPGPPELVTRQALLDAIEPVVLAEGSVTVTYERPR